MSTLCSSWILFLLVLLLVAPSIVCSFVPSSTQPKLLTCCVHRFQPPFGCRPLPTIALYESSSDYDDDDRIDESSHFPVLSRIQGINWQGDCRYVNEELKPLNLDLTGGTRYDIKDDFCSLSSFLAFPDGRTRQVQMQGKRGSLQRPSFRLDPVSPEGPIYMVVTELPPDTVLLNEVDKATGKIILTSSLSIINSDGGQELVQVSHEVGQGKDSPIVEGHQVWRLSKKEFLSFE